MILLIHLRHVSSKSPYKLVLHLIPCHKVTSPNDAQKFHYKLFYGTVFLLLGSSYDIFSVIIKTLWRIMSYAVSLPGYTLYIFTREMSMQAMAGPFLN
jgi:hypothetical protein